LRDRIDYQIIVTLGPSSSTPDGWLNLYSAGATAFRLNTSHLTVDELSGWLERYTIFLADQGKIIPLVLDLQGSKWRLGLFQSQELKPQSEIELVLADQSQSPGQLPVPHPDFFHAAEFSSSQIVLSDARIRLKTIKASSEVIRAEVIQGGKISSRKGITYAVSSYRTEKLNTKDHQIIEQTRRYPYVRFAFSYVKDVQEMAKYKELVEPPGYLIAKLERQPAIDQASMIAEYADELWLCRGDLGAELGLRAMAEAVHSISQQVRKIRTPVILAGQVLEHLTSNPLPTRSEVCHLYEMLANGYQGVVLSDETAIGKYPLESVQAAAMFR
jgi:pyruvate kinase